MYLRDDPDSAPPPAIPFLRGDLVDLEEAWKMYTWCEATQWRHLPDAGGLLDQDELLMENVFMILAAANRLRHPAEV